MKLAIRTNDNDYNKTWLALMLLLVQRLEKEPDLIYSKGNLVTLINHSAVSLYLITRDRFSMLDFCGLSEKQTYLSINEGHIYVNEEVDQFIQKQSWGDNQETIVYDSTIYQKEQQIYLF